MKNLSFICEKVIEIAQNTGNFINAEAIQFNSDKVEFKGFNDLVSYVDKVAEKRIIECLKKILPEAGFIAEESALNTHIEGLNWIIDPLDGTTNFIHGIPTYAVSIALYEGLMPLIGVVYEINRKEMFYTYRGANAYLNGSKIKVSDHKSIKTGLVATGFPYYNFELESNYMNLLAEMLKSCQGVRRMGAAAVDLVYVACGRFTSFFEYNLKPWDVAAGAFIVQQAGGQCTNFKGGADFFNPTDVMASNGKVHQEVLAMLKKHF